MRWDMTSAELIENQFYPGARNRHIATLDQLIESVNAS